MICWDPTSGKASGGAPVVAITDVEEMDRE